MTPIISRIKKDWNNSSHDEEDKELSLYAADCGGYDTTDEVTLKLVEDVFVLNFKNGDSYILVPWTSKTKE